MADEVIQPETKKSSMMPMITALVLLLLIGAGIYLFMSNNKNAANTQPDNAMTEQQDVMTAEPTTEQQSPTAADAMTDEAGVKTFTVDANNFSFSVKEMKIKKGDTVKVVFNNKQGFHDWVLDEFNAQTKQLPAGQSETIEFVANQAGTFEYYCSVGNHRQMGMVGNLIVEE